MILPLTAAILIALLCSGTGQNTIITAAMIVGAFTLALYGAWLLRKDR